jgi:phage-related protein
MEDYIGKMTLATGVADDELRPAMANLLRATGDAKTSQEAMNQVLDISASTGKDVEAVSQAVAKAYGGSTGSLKKLIPSLDDAVLAGGDMEQIMAAVADQTGGAMAASADTAAGKMKIFQNAMGEAQEEAGSALLPLMTKLSGVLVTLATWIGENTTLFVIIAGVIATVAAGILIMNLAITVYTAVTTIAGIVSAASWGAALLPILLVIAAVIAVTAVIVILWKKSETFRSIVTGVWNGIKAAIEFVIDAVGDLIGWIGKINIPGSIANAFDKIREAVETVWNWVGKIIEKIGGISVPGIIEKAFSDIRGAVEAAWNWVGNLIGKIGNITVPGFIKDTFDNIKTAIEGAWNKVGDLISAIGRISIPGVFVTAFNNVRDAIQGVISKVEDLIGWLSRIHVPKIDLPGPLGKTAAAPAVPQVARFAAPGVPAPRATSSTSGGGVSIVVNGALDPEATARQIRRILAGHTRRVGLVAP